MTNSLAVACPHCSVRIKIASQEMLGKKGTCPKCNESFVIGAKKKKAAARKTPVKKKSEIQPLHDFVEDWIDDVDDDYDVENKGVDKRDKRPSPPPAKSVKKPTKKKKKNKVKQTASKGVTLVGKSLIFFIKAMVSLSVVATAICFVMGMNDAKLLFIPWSLFRLQGIPFIIGGTIAFGICVAKEGVQQFLLWMFIPFYSVYFALTRW